MITRARTSTNNQQNIATHNTNNSIMSFANIKADTFIFPHATLTPIAGEPTHATIKTLKSELYANARHNLTTLGGGNLGYMGILMTAADYAKLQTDAGNPNPDAFDIPAAPAALTAASTDIEKSDFQEAKQHRANCNAMEALLQQQIIAAIDAKYIKKIKNATFGFACIKCERILQHIITTYDKITPEDMLLNQEALGAPFDCNNPIVDLWERIDECQQFAIDGGAPIHDVMVMVTILKVIKETGQFTTFVAHWNRMKDPKTLDEFTEYFTDCDTERKLQTAKEAGYHSANNTKTITPSTAIISTTNAPSHIICNDHKVYYCHTHGGTLNSKHTSATCSNPGPNHVRNSSWTNPCNGCTIISVSKPARSRNNNGNGNNNNNNGNNNNGNNNNGNNNNGNNNNGNNNNSNKNNNNNNNNNNGNNNNNNGNNNNNNGNNNSNNNGNNNGNSNNNNNNIKTYSAAVTSSDN
jgi:hypothetical protein